jgi:cholesterol 25-hydroxylase
MLGSLWFVAIFIPSVFQPLLSRLYSFLCQSSFYGFSGFETIQTVRCYIIIEPLYTYRFGRNPQLRIDVRGAGLQLTDRGKPKVPKMRWPSKSMGELITYASPLDFTMIKKFAGVRVSDLRQTGGYRPLTDAEMESIQCKLPPTNVA